jgi:hypothetical protein
MGLAVGDKKPSAAPARDKRTEDPWRGFVNEDTGMTISTLFSRSSSPAALPARPLLRRRSRLEGATLMFLSGSYDIKQKFEKV